MKRFHVHMRVDDLAEATRFYAALFGAAPTVEKPDYVKWMLDDPRINLAITSGDGARGVDHVGLQADSEAELEELNARLQAARVATLDEPGAQCCYARSDKHWAVEPSGGVVWEMFHTMGAAETYGDDHGLAARPAAAAGGAAPGCCG